MGFVGRVIPKKIGRVADSRCEVLQTFMQTDAGVVQITAVLPSAFPAEQQMVLTSGSDARVEATGRLL